MEWIKWEGGECPVPRGTWIDVEYRSGVRKFEIQALVPSDGDDATRHYWGRDGLRNDIVAYRLSNLGTQPRMTREEAYEDAAKPISDNALNEQVGGNHYLQFEIQPIEFINANKLDFLSGNVVKYISRHRMKGGAEDVNKAIHYCKLILEMQYGEDK